MRRFLLLALVFTICIGSGSFALAADTFTVKKGGEWRIGDIIKKEVVFTWVDESGDGVSQTINMAERGSDFLALQGWLLYQCTTDPGSPSPTDDYDLTILDKYGVDKLYGAGLNRDETNSEDAYPISGFPVVNGPTWTFTISGNSQAGATAVAACIFFSN